MFGFNQNKSAETELKHLRAELASVKGEKQEKKAKRIMNKIIRVQLFRFQNTIELWKTAIEDFENVQFPINEDLIRVYNDAVLDAHLSALLELRKQKTTGSEFKIVDESGEKNDDETALVEKQWFVDAMNHAFFAVRRSYRQRFQIR